MADRITLVVSVPTNALDDTPACCARERLQSFLELGHSDLRLESFMAEQPSITVRVSVYRSVREYQNGASWFVRIECNDERVDAPITSGAAARLELAGVPRLPNGGNV